jgi:hypothetical protein
VFRPIPRMGCSFTGTFRHAIISGGDRWRSSLDREEGDSHMKRVALALAITTSVLVAVPGSAASASTGWARWDNSGSAFCGD